MNAQSRGLRVAGAIFGIMALAQLARLLIRPEILIAGHAMPLWPSMIAFVVLATLCTWLWRLAAK